MIEAVMLVPVRDNEGRSLMRAYKTINRGTVDLSCLTPEEQEFLDRAYEAYRSGASWGTLVDLVEGTENPLIRATGGIITRAVYDHPLYRATRDLQNRAGIRDGVIAAEPSDALESDPLQDSQRIT